LILDERTILIRSCRDHVVATCPRCMRTYRYLELAIDRSTYQPHLCRACRADLTEPLREHMRRCLGALLEWTHQVRERARIAQTESHQVRDQSEVSRAEREALRQRPADTVATCAHCNESLGADRIKLVFAPGIFDFVHAACLGPARERLARLGLDVRRNIVQNIAHVRRAISGGGGPSGSALD
jgi:hypothetical protein